VATVCKGKKRCCKCGGEHDYGQCEEGVEPKCCNCGGPHSAAFLGCKAQKQATEAMRIKTVQNISYAQAVKQVQVTNGDLIENNITQSKDTCSHKCVEDGNILVINKINFVAFIAEVINWSAQTDKRTEKLKIIISAAELPDIWVLLKYLWNRFKRYLDKLMEQ